MKKKIFGRVVIALFALVVLFIGYQIFTIQATYAALDDVPAEYVYGPEDADLTVVEFIKYTCPHCRDIHPIIMQAVQQDGRVRYIPRILPSDRVQDAELAYAAGQQGAFKMAHEMLLKDPNILQEGGLDNIRTMIGGDQEKLKADMEGDEVKRLIGSNIHVFRNLGFNRTPTFMIGRNIMYVPQDKMPTVEDFLRMFNEARGEKQP